MRKLWVGYGQEGLNHVRTYQESQEMWDLQT